MTRILVDPDQLRSLSTRFEQVSQDLRAVAGRANASWSNLDLIVRQKAAIGGQVSEAVNRGHALAREAMVKANYLLTKAQAFEDADGQGAASLPTIPPHKNQPRWWPPVYILPVPPKFGWRDLLPGWSIDDILRGVPPILPPIFIGLPIITLPLLPRPPWFPGPKPAPQPEPVPTPTPTPPGPSERHQPQQPTPVQPPTKTAPTPVRLDPKVKPGDYDKRIGCVKYAQDRRPDLGASGKGAADYITKFKDKVFQITDQNMDLRDKIATGYAIVWPRGHSDLKGTAGETYGHVAIVEEVGPDYVVVSQAGWGKKTSMKISRTQLASLYVIP